MASLANLLPSIFFPLIPKKILFFLTSFELIQALLIIALSFSLFSSFSSIIFVFQLLFNFRFFSLIDFNMQILSEKYFFFLYSWYISWPFPATTTISSDLMFLMAVLIASSLDEISINFFLFICILISFLIFFGFSLLGLSSVK